MPQGSKVPNYGVPRKPVAHNLQATVKELEGIVAHYFWLLGFPGVYGFYTRNCNSGLGNDILYLGTQTLKDGIDKSLLVRRPLRPSSHH